MEENPDICPLCKITLGKHKRCEACLIFLGNEHTYPVLPPYRGHQLCGSCIARWEHLEKLAGHEITIERMCTSVTPKEV
jgi:hypothetical protein